VERYVTRTLQMCSPFMSQHARTIGYCPRCDAPIGQADVLIRYDRRDGEAMYATCPGCEDVIRLD